MQAPKEQKKRPDEDEDLDMRLERTMSAPLNTAESVFDRDKKYEGINTHKSVFDRGALFRESKGV